MCEGCANSSGGQRKVIHKPVASPHYSDRVSAQQFIVATAGHVDHSKSALVKALTGTDPDRLPEEKARGITIDLGFAHLELPTPDLLCARTDLPLPVRNERGEGHPTADTPEHVQ